MMVRQYLPRLFSCEQYRVTPSIFIARWLHGFPNITTQLDDNSSCASIYCNTAVASSNTKNKN